MTQYEKDMILSIKRGAVSICQASSTGENIIASLEIAEHIAKDSERGKVLYINTVQTERQLASEIRKHISKDYTAEKSDPRLTYLSSAPGLLASLGKQIRRILDSGVKFIIINSLEFSWKDHRRKDELLYQIMDWTNLYGTAVLIFSEEVNTDPITGKIHRGGGGIGKLSALAKNIFHITSEADRKEPVDFKTSMSSVVLEDDDDDFSELDKRILAAAAEDIAAIESAPNWKPANHKEELAIYEAYMKNHPETNRSLAFVPSLPPIRTAPPTLAAPSTAEPITF